MTPHPDRLALFAYVEGDDMLDPAPVDEHLRACAECRETVASLRQVVALLSEGEVLEYLQREDLGREPLRDALADEIARASRQWLDATPLFTSTRDLSPEAWDELFARHPERKTGCMVRRLLDEVEVELNRRPEHALLLTDVAERIALSLPEAESRSILGDVWKHRSNALRHLGRYQAALDAARHAESIYESLLAGAFDVAQAQYASAATLFKMMRYAEALEVLDRAHQILRDFGLTVPLVRNMMLNAAIRLEQGDVAGAEARWREVLPLVERLGDDVEHARILANLAECNLRLGDPDLALADARLAVARYRALRMEAESIRSEWTIGMAVLARGESEDGLAVLRAAAAKFESLGMSGDAGFVNLDVVEELLRRGEWREAEATARELVMLFTRAKVTIASVSALDFLRQAVVEREATEATVKYVREFVSADDPAQTFRPPSVM